MANEKDRGIPGDLVEGVDRERGIFTERDRRFLIGDDDVLDELDDNAKRQKRYRLRKRIENAIQDLAYLHQLDVGDVAQLTATKDGEDGEWNSEGSRAVLAFIELVSYFHRRFGEETFQRVVSLPLTYSRQVDHAEETGEYLPLDVEISVTQAGEPIPIEELIAQRERGEDLPPTAQSIITFYTRRGED